LCCRGTERLDAPASGTRGGMDGSLLAIILLVMLTGDRRWIVAGCVAYTVGVAAVLWSVAIAELACATSASMIYLVDIAVVAGMLAFRHMLVRHGLAAQESRSLAREARSRVAALRAQEDVREHHLRQVMTTAGPLLEQLADGTLDPADPAVRSRCAAEESHLRLLIGLGDGLGQLGDAIMEIARRAELRGVGLSARPIEFDVALDAAAAAWIADVLGSAVAGLRPRDAAVLTAFARTDRGMLTLVYPDRGEAERDHPPPGVTATRTVDDGQALLEVEWSLSPV